jgi:DNA-formamidopyrimidine glycosylase
MPELPEVETIAKNLREGNGSPPVPGRRIVSFSTDWPRHVEHPSLQSFNRRIKDREIVDVKRRGKYLVFPLDRETLLIHLRMSGDLRLAPTQDPKDRFDHTLFNLDNGWDLRFSDARKFGRVSLYADPEVILGRLGPEPLAPNFTHEQLADMLHARKRLLKPLLLDQSFLAGLGNIYTDEALHQAGSRWAYTTMAPASTGSFVGVTFNTIFVYINKKGNPVLIAARKSNALSSVDAAPTSVRTVSRRANHEQSIDDRSPINRRWYSFSGRGLLGNLRRRIGQKAGICGRDKWWR